MIRSTLLLLIVASGRLLAAEPGAEAQSAVRKSLSFLRNDMRTWRQQRRCAACHHGPMYLWAASVAHKQGYVVDDADIAETTQWLVTSDEARIFPKATPAGSKRPQLSLATIHLAHALNTLPANDPLRQRGWKQIGDHLAAAQAHDGSWAGPAGRPPIINTPQTMTRLAQIAVSEAGPSAGVDVLSRAKAWLTRVLPEVSHHGPVLRLWSEGIQSQTDATNGVTAAKAINARLWSLQRADGGWSQSDTSPSDAFATGQTLVALHRLGVPLDDDRVKWAIAFLTRTKHSDGTSSCLDPASGKPAKNLNSITYAATAWAVIGLCSYVPESATAPSRQTKTAPSLTRGKAMRGRAVKDCPIGECPGG
jgi:hypothetical protein